MANIIGQITINHMSILELDDDPVFTGADVLEGSFALFEHGDKGRIYKKVGPNPTNWLEIERKIIEVGLLLDQTIIGNDLTQLLFDDEYSNDDARYFTLLPTGEIQVNVAGAYIAGFTGSINIESGNKKATSTCLLYVNGIARPNTRVFNFHMDATFDESSAGIYNAPLDLQTGDLISVIGNKVTVQASSDLQFLADSCRLTVEKKF